MLLLGLIIGSISGFIAILPFVVIFHFVLCKKFKSNNIKVEIPHIMAAYIFCFFLVAILSTTGVPSLPYVKFDVNINLIPFKDISSNFIQYIENIILFIPLGFALPLLWKRFEKKHMTFICGLLFSLAVEISQLFNFRATDIDDILMNTLGIIAGYFLYIFIKMMFPKIIAFNDNGAVYFRLEVYFYIAFAWLAIFFIHPYISTWIWRFIL